MSTPKLFEFNEHPIQVMQDEVGNAWFLAKDVCLALEYSKYRDALAKHTDDDERMSIRVDTLGGKQKRTFVNESGLYSLVFGSSKKEAKVFLNLLPNVSMVNNVIYGEKCLQKCLQC